MTHLPRVVCACLVLASVVSLLTWPRAADAAEPLRSTAELLGYRPTDRLLIINADDLGMSHATNLAIFDAFEHGVLTSSTVMMPTAWVKEVVDWAKLHPQANIGVHLTLTSEWARYKWAPVAGRAAVPGLVSPDGFMWSDGPEVWKGATPQEAETEARAQIDLARKLGIEPTHIDSHMGTLQENAEFWKVYLKLGAAYRLPQRQASAAAYEALGGRGMKEAERAAGVLGPDELLFELKRPADPSGVPAWYEQVLRGLKPGLTELYLHPAIDGPEMQAISGTHAFRDADYRWLIDPRTKALIDELGIKLISYRELLNAMRGTATK
ncbi:MAG: polysaccharide deacetylase family protein [Armatimonadetes bacterium]|nr:polysaccharide deacetylase family protein [Armatimonadota bacterium]